MTCRLACTSETWSRVALDLMTIDPYLACSVTLWGAGFSIYRYSSLCATGTKEVEMKRLLVVKDRALLLDGKDVDTSNFSPSGFGS